MDLEIRCPVCDMKLPVTISPDFTGRVRVLCVSKRCGKAWVVFDTKALAVV